MSPTGSYQLRGRGRVTRPSGEIVEVDYLVNVIQKMLATIPGQPPVPGMRNISGVITFRQDPDFNLFGEDLEFELEDSRKLRIWIKSFGRQSDFRVSDAGDFKGET